MIKTHSFLIISLLVILSCRSGNKDEEKEVKDDKEIKIDLAAYRSHFDNELNDWTRSIADFDLLDFALPGIAAFEDLPFQETDSLQSFYSIYKPALSFSPDSSKFIDIYSYQLALSKEGDQIISGGGDVDQSISLCDLRTKKWKRILFFGPAASIQEVTWIDDMTFILVGVEETLTKEDILAKRPGKSSPFIYVGRTDTRLFEVFSNDNPLAVQTLSYESAKLKKLHIIER